MIDRLIHWSLTNRFLVLCGTLLLIALGLWSLRTIPIDAIPDLSENQVIVYADWSGRSPQEVEDQITYPLTVNLQGLAGVKAVRGSSMFGFSLITVIFEDRIDNYFARTRVLERLNYLGASLPAGVTPRLGPDATGLGWVYQYYLAVDPAKAPDGGYDLGQLRSVQDYLIRYELNSAPGVAEVASVGGFVRQYEIEVSSAKMKARGVTLQKVLEAVAASNLNVGGKTIDENGLEFSIRGVGLITSIADLENIGVGVKDGTPIFLRDLANVQIGGDFRRGALDVNGHEVVGGIVVMRSGENAYAVIREVKDRIAKLQSSLPPGVSIQPFYDRSDLIGRAIDTLKHALVEEIILVTLAHILFLWHFRSILIVTLPLPASILVSFILMKQFGVTSHIMSLTGIAISIGVLVDAGIVMTENVIRACEAAEGRVRRRLTREETFETVLRASQQVGRPVFFAMAIIVLAFVPVFVLGGQEGKLFHPLALAKTFAMAGATLLAVTLVPVLCTLLVRGPFKAEHDNVLMRGLLALYQPVLKAALRHGKIVLGVAVLSLVGAGLLVPRLGSEFMPTLEEGSILFMPVLLPGTSLTEVKRILAWQDAVIKQVPEVVSVAGKLGRADTATDPAPVEMIETTIILKPAAEWRPGLTKAALIAELSQRLSAVPGYVPGFLQPIENRILMLSTGIRAQVGVKLLGSDLPALQRKALEVEKVVRSIPGATGVAASRTQGAPYLDIVLNRPAIARYGLTVRDVFDVIETGLGGTRVGVTWGAVAATPPSPEGSAASPPLPATSTTEPRGYVNSRERWPIQVRLGRDEREDLDRLGDLLVPTPAGPFIPLGQLATLTRTPGPSEIDSENGRLRVFVQANVQGRDLGGFVREIEDRVRQEVVLDPGMTILMSGQYENQLHAEATLRAVVPAVLLIIFLLLVVVFRSISEAALVMLAVPFALTGGILLQYLLGYPFSTAVWIGYIALFGTAIQTGVVMVLYLEEAVVRVRAECDAAGRMFQREDLLRAIREGARLRLRPKVMTVSTVIASLLPVMWSTRAGAEVMKPLATPVIGGMASSLVLILIVTPILFYWLHGRRLS